MEEKRITAGENKVELNDEQMDTVAGGLFIQPKRESTCSKCGKRFDNDSGRAFHESTCNG